ncbi:hypothetical protein C0993_008129 [Termitomyces sp. T159_Od127]|nr:hypothetical protein C0993_008129 [Termitomyces sp. T159_Od127]
MLSKASIFATACLVLSTAVTATPQKQKRQLAQVITECTVPNTAALTFVRSLVLVLVYIDFLIFPISMILRTMVLGCICELRYEGAGARMETIVSILRTIHQLSQDFSFADQCIYDADEIKRVRYAFDKGHQVASHTWAHKDLTTLTWDQIHDEMWRVELALSRIVGVVPAFMRPPYGNYNDLVRQASAIRGQKLVIWDFEYVLEFNVTAQLIYSTTHSSEDSIGATPAESEANYDDVIAEHPNTILALNHETIGKYLGL